VHNLILNEKLGPGDIDFEEIGNEFGIAAKAVRGRWRQLKDALFEEFNEDDEDRPSKVSKVATKAVGTKKGKPAKKEQSDEDYEDEVKLVKERKPKKLARAKTYPAPKAKGTVVKSGKRHVLRARDAEDSLSESDAEETVGKKGGNAKVSKVKTAVAKKTEEKSGEIEMEDEENDSQGEDDQPN